MTLDLQRLRPLLFALLVASCAGEEEVGTPLEPARDVRDDPGEAEPPDTETDAPEPALDVGFDTAGDLVDSGDDAVDATGGLPCLGRDPVCDAPTTPLTTDLLRGVVALAVYESDWFRCPYGADCGRAPHELFLVATERRIDDAEQARSMLEAEPTRWLRIDDQFEIETAEGPHLLCGRQIGPGGGLTHCASIEFGPNTVVTTVLWTTFGDGLLYATRHSDGEQLSTFYLPPQ